MRVAVLVAWGVIVFAVFLVTVILGISDTDRDGRVAMPGKAVVRLAPGDYGIWYEEPHATSDNEVFEPPDGIRVDVRPVEDEPDPVVDLGGIGSQVGTGSRTAETIGKVTISAAGAYRLVAGSRVGGPSRADITLGPTGSEGFVLGAKRAGFVSVAFVLLLVLVEIRRRTRPQPAVPGVPLANLGLLVAAPAGPLAAAPGTPARATVVSAVPLVTFPAVGEPSYTITMRVNGGPPVASGHRVPPGQEARLVPGAELPVRIEPVSGKVLGVEWHLP